MLKLKSIYSNLEVNQEFLVNKENSYLLKTKVKQKNIIISTIHNSDFYKKNNIEIPNININNNLIKNTK
ncbi:hypothetical protein HOF65_01240 [bacterium]|nr:hypothetical protein [bacterium]MBT4633752.1 hypothetical protein [bacterium]MBT6779278.1 hypothetical protein [bacterium]